MRNILALALHLGENPNTVHDPENSSCTMKHGAGSILFSGIHFTLQGLEDQSSMIARWLESNTGQEPCDCSRGSSSNKTTILLPKLHWRGFQNQEPECLTSLQSPGHLRLENCSLLMVSIQSDRAWAILPSRMGNCIWNRIWKADRDIIPLFPAGTCSILLLKVFKTLAKSGQPLSIHRNFTTPVTANSSWLRASIAKTTICWGKHHTAWVIMISESYHCVTQSCYGCESQCENCKLRFRVQAV